MLLESPWENSLDRHSSPSPHMISHRAPCPDKSFATDGRKKKTLIDKVEIFGKRARDLLTCQLILMINANIKNRYAQKFVARGRAAATT